jgi:dTDP-4-dehydrorhamnose reductase
MRIVVTGKEGQLVRCLAERAAGHPALELVPLGRPELDLLRPDEAEASIAALSPDLVINAAAYTAVDQAEEEPELAMAINGSGAGAVARAARRAGARLIQVSTDYVFDGSAPGAYTETDPTAPLGAYGRSKLEGERAALEAHPEAAVVRTAWVYSPFGRNFVKTMIAAAASRPELKVVADQRGCPTSALDIADGLLSVAEAWRAGAATGVGQVYHLAGTGTASWFDFAAEVLAALAQSGGPSVPVRPVATADWPTRAARPANSVLDSTRFARDFGYVMPDWRSSVRSTVARIVSDGR